MHQLNNFFFFFNIKNPACMNGAFNLAIHPITNFIALFLKLKQLLRDKKFFLYDIRYMKEATRFFERHTWLAGSLVIQG